MHAILFRVKVLKSMERMNAGWFESMAMIIMESFLMTCSLNAVH